MPKAFFLRFDMDNHTQTVADLLKKESLEHETQAIKLQAEYERQMAEKAK